MHTPRWTRSDRTIAFNAHYDGKVIRPDEPVDLTPNQTLIVRIEAKSADESPANESTVPSDLSHQHDHYLYRAPIGAMSERRLGTGT
jgi:hypothetical protein